MKIEHFAFEVSNLNTSLRFYVESLGFKVQYTYTDEQTHENLAMLEIAGGKLELIQVLNEDNQSQQMEPIILRKHLCPHLALQTDDIEQMLIHIKDCGVTLVREPAEILGVAKWFFVCDPDQNVIEFFQDFQSGQGAAHSN